MPSQPTGTRVPVGRVRPGALAPAAERRSLGARECLLCQRSTVRYGSIAEAPNLVSRSRRLDNPNDEQSFGCDQRLAKLLPHVN